jgi:hypothetical protein
MTDAERLAHTQRAYDAGDFARVRALGGELARSADADVATQGATWLARVSIDGVSLGVLGCCLLFFLLVARHYVF